MTRSAQVEFVRDLRWADVPPAVREHVRLLLADLAAVCVAGRPAPASELAAAYASAVHPGDEATALLDGRRLGAVGAAWCNGVLANVLDYDDGHRLTKGHPGRGRHPRGARRRRSSADATAEELLVAVVVGYEIAIRAGVALHARDDGYHASGAWGGLGAAAAAARLLGLDATAIHHAIGLAEYHAPIAHIMRVGRAARDDEGRLRLGRVGRHQLRAHGGRRLHVGRRGLPRRRTRATSAASGGSRSSTSRRTPAAAGRRARSARRSRRAAASGSRRRTSRRSRSRRSPPPTRSPRSCPSLDGGGAVQPRLAGRERRRHAAASPSPTSSARGTTPGSGRSWTAPAWSSIRRSRMRSRRGA